MARCEDGQVERYSPSVRRRRLGRALRALREAQITDAGALTSEQAARDLGMSPSNLTKLETADRSISKTALLGVLGYYNATTRDRDELLDLHAQSREKGWFQRFGVQIGAFVDWESEAVKEQSFEPLVFPGILQLGAYADAVFAASHPDLTDQERARWAQVRTTRAALLDDPGETTFWLIIGEAAFRTKVGSTRTTAAQIERVLALAKNNPAVNIQVLPFEAGAHMSMTGAFHVLTFVDLPPLGCVEHLLTTAWFDRPRDVTDLTTAFGRLSAQALPVADSVSWMEAL
jgi:transcriptional regulator with XRE-family HTH domain